MGRYRISLVTAVLFFLTGCGAFTERTRIPADPVNQAAAVAAWERVSGTNPRLDTFKGIGTARFLKGNQSYTARVAWVGAAPDRLRVEIMGAVGQSGVSLASDGERVYVLSRLENRFHTTSASGTTLESVMGAPLGIEDVVSVLAGRVPREGFEAERIIFGAPGEGSLLILRRGRRDGERRIHLDPSGDRVTRFEAVTPGGDLRYAVVFQEMQTVGPYTVPKRLQILGRGGEGVTLEIERYWVDVPVTDSQFVVAPSA